MKPNLQIKLELTDREVQYLTQCCIARVAKSAIDAVPDDYDYFGDLEGLVEVMEPIRWKLVHAVFRSQAEGRTG